MQRITIEKNEAVADLVERILEAQDREITLVVPKDSHLLDSASNFRLIAREAGVLGKDISIESVDQKVLAHAKAAGLQASHPLFDERARAGEGQSFSDIVPRGRRKATPAREEKKLKVKAVRQPEPEEIEPPAASAAAAGVIAPAAAAAYEADAEADMDDVDDVVESRDSDRDLDRDGDIEEERYDTLEPRSRWGRKAAVWALALVVLVGAGMWVTAYAFGKATVTVNFKKAPWTYSGPVTATVAAKGVDANANTLPAELAEPAQNLTRSFPATGRTTGGVKAHGTLTIVNNFGAEPQELVATTRFQTPDGKIYRLDSGTIVPGAKVDGAGKVTEQGTIKVPVTADQPGPSYNSGPVEKLTIPGFQGTAKFNGFYGTLAEGAAGGGTDGGAVPTPDDIEKAKQSMASGLDDGFKATFLASVPSDFKVLPQATAMSTTTYTVSQAVDTSGNFSVTASTVFRALEFRERDILELLKAKASAQGAGGKVMKDLTIAYNNATPNFTGKQLSFTVDANATLVPDFDAKTFAATVAGKSRDEARQALLGLPDLEDAQVSLWPAWLWKLPDDPARVNVVVQ